MKYQHGSALYLNEVEQQRGLEHPVQFDVVVQEQILETSSGAELSDDGENTAVVEETEERVHVFMTHVLHLQIGWR